MNELPLPLLSAVRASRSRSPSTTCRALNSLVRGTRSAAGPPAARSRAPAGTAIIHQHHVEQERKERDPQRAQVLCRGNGPSLIVVGRVCFGMGTA